MSQPHSPVLPDCIRQNSSHEPPVINGPLFLIFFHVFSMTSREDFDSFITRATFKASSINLMPRPEVVSSSMGTEKVCIYWPSETETATRLPAKDDHVGEIPCQFFMPVRGRSCGIGILTVQPTCWKDGLHGTNNVAG